MAELRPILLVEDSLKDIELVLAALKKNNFANEVVVARDGAEALDYLYRRGKFQSQACGPPIVMLLDLKMPKVDGLEVLRQIKGDEALKLLPVVMLTSSREEEDLVKSYRLGVNAYVVKPVGFQQFVDAIKQTGMFWAVINEPPPVEPAD
ncbi:MAG TPA: response regulator [Burkholderiales bacterium]